ncbi:MULTISPECIES: invasion associated locus B family protein [Meridianimarinicoccus]|uniref:invasion associated locus B family protein n=1 Tax=Meridianimarinicoccus zhengii TaxID=2056810 RepID=UPI000DAB876B|nr:invasion associated locus B family protein [Phycocomes zhengii]
MTRFLLASLIAVFGAGIAVAQESDIPQSRAAAEPGQPYQLGRFNDWDVRCLRVEDGTTDPCEMHQLLRGPEGNATAEINLFLLERDDVPAGATIVTPLETLLTQGLRLNVDGAEGKTYPFQLCNRQGCVAQIGFTPEEIETMKGGTEAEVTVRPAAAPETPVRLTISLAGFTAAHEALTVAALGN